MKCLYCLETLDDKENTYGEDGGGGWDKSTLHKVLNSREILSSCFPESFAGTIEACW